MRIRTRLSLAVAGITGILVVTGGVLIDRQLRQSVASSIDDALTTRTDPIVAALSNAAVARPPEVADLVQLEPLAQVLDPAHRVVFSSGSLASTPILSGRQLGRATRTQSGFSLRVGRSPNADDFRVLATPVLRPDGTWLVVVGDSIDSTEVALGHSHVAVIIGGSIAIIGAAIGAWVLAGAALRPVERMRRQVAQLSEQVDKASIAVPRTRDELARMATTMNEILDRLYTSRAHDRRLIADASHELRTPLAVLRTELELAARPGRSYEDLSESVAQAAVEADRLSRLAEDLLLLARLDQRAPAAHYELTPIDALLRAAADAWRSRAEANDVKIAVTSDGDPTVRGDADALRRAIENLLDNALRVAPSGSTIDLSARTSGEACVVEVLDEGPGFSPEFLPQAFERFSRPDRVRGSHDGGSGLGLAIVAAIASMHGGEATAEPRVPRGACVRIVLPSALDADSPVTNGAP